MAIDKDETPRSYAAMMAALDDAGKLTRMEPIWETMESLEREWHEEFAKRGHETAALERRIAELRGELENIAAASPKRWGVEPHEFNVQFRWWAHSRARHRIEKDDAG